MLKSFLKSFLKYLPGLSAKAGVDEGLTISLSSVLQVREGDHALVSAKDQMAMPRRAQWLQMLWDNASLPKNLYQYHTLISELGGSLSGGQKQRLMIARALYRQPAILFLDEATSHLDAENERQINAAIQALNITRVIIAHRPSTIASADRVVDLTAVSPVLSRSGEAKA